MTPPPEDEVAALFAVDPVGLGGVVLRAAAGPARDAWARRLTALLPADTPSHRIPLHIGDDRLLGGLDLASTLQAGRVVAQRGVLATSDGGIVWLAMAERLSVATAARLAAVLDTGQVVTERDGTALRAASRIGVVALDEGLAEDEAAPPRLRERCAFWLALDPRASAHARERPPPAETAGRPPDAWADRVAGPRLTGPTRADIAAARGRLPTVDAPDDIIEGLCAAALALGIDSVRAPLLALRAAKAAAALAGRGEVSAVDAACAARLVLAPRAARVPAREAVVDEADEPEPPAAPAEEASDAPGEVPPPEIDGSASASEPTPRGLDADTPTATDRAPGADAPAPDSSLENEATAGHATTEVVLQAALAAIPPHLLDALTASALGAARASTSGRSGLARVAALRGRPCGVRRAVPRGGARLNLIETLRAAAPWQALRRHETGPDAAAAGRRIIVRREDFHVTRHLQRSETTTVFVVDASGSAALHRLAEAKGAVELLLADCYVRRDSVAVIAFRGRGAELLLPPTRSLARAKRSLAGLPGGGGTPLAAGLDAATALGDAVRRRGATPLIVLLTDGRGNIALDGSAGRAAAGRDAQAAARRLRAGGFASLVLDTASRPEAAARDLAGAMGAAYLALPHAAAPALSQAVREAGSFGSRSR